MAVPATSTTAVSAQETGSAPSAAIHAQPAVRRARHTGASVRLQRFRSGYRAECRVSPDPDPDPGDWNPSDALAPAGTR
ncbi:MAG TPA: hypothetical protein VKI23_02345, partial [Cellulomonadaceae bacterium]|nr:hypothetical protein [Cellulomonadaceae bacterium]